MINVTEKAKKELKKLLVSKVDWPEARLRLIDRGNGVLGLGVDIETPGDKIVECGGKAVLVIEPGLADKPERITLDVAKTRDGVELIVIEEAAEQSPATPAAH